MLHTQWRFRLRDPAGRLLTDSGWVHNVLTREGAQLLLDVFFRNSPASYPDHFELALINSTPTVTTTALTMSGEVSGNGYARLVISRTLVDWPTLAPVYDGGPVQVESITQAFTATTGTIGPFASGAILAYIPDPLDNTRLVPRLVAAASTGLVTAITLGNTFDATVRLSLTP